MNQVGALIPDVARVDEVFPIQLIACDFSEVDTISINTSLLYDSSNEDECDKFKDNCLCFSINAVGLATVTIDIVFKDLSTKQIIKAINILSEVDDIVFSSDDQLQIIDSNILSHLPCGRTSWLYKIRQATSDIVQMMTEFKLLENNSNCSCLCDSSGNYIGVSPSDLYNIDDVRQWANYYTLYLVHNELNDQVGDIHSVKADYYYKMASAAMDRSRVRFKSSSGFYLPIKRRVIKLVRTA